MVLWYTNFMPQESFSSKKIILIGIIILILAGAVVYVLFNRSAQLQETGSFSVRNIFPFGDQPPTLQPTDSSPSTDEPLVDGPSGDQVITFSESARLRRITNYPITGFTSFLTSQIIQEPKLDEKTNETVFVSTTVPLVLTRFNSKLNGIISDAELTRDAIIINQKTITEVPAAEEVWFTKQGDHVFYRSWNENNLEIDTVSGIIPPEPQQNDSEVISEPQSLSSLSFLPGNILRGDVSPNGNNIFFLRNSQNGVSGTLTDHQGLSPKTIFTSPFTEWKPIWIDNNLISLTTLASREADGYMYQLDSRTSVVKKLLGPVRGLATITNPVNSLTLYSTSTDQGIRTRLFNHVSGTVTSLDTSTLAEKCTWKDTSIIICAVPVEVPSGNYPDAWYQGIVSFSDQFWLINTTNQSTQLLFTPTEPTDGVQLGISPDKNYLLFINKINGTLWSYRLEE